VKAGEPAIREQTRSREKIDNLEGVLRVMSPALERLRNSQQELATKAEGGKNEGDVAAKGAW